MSREIKFRAWDGEKMIIPKYIKDGHAYIYKYYIEKCEYYYDRCNIDNIPSVAKEIPIQTDYPINQYTGLKDCNGVKIFEGDILNIRNINYIVTYCSKDGRYEAYGKVYYADTPPICSPHDWHLYCVVGNIYENKDLINE